MLTCTPCEVWWSGHGDCWNCGKPGTTPPRHPYLMNYYAWDPSCPATLPAGPPPWNHPPLEPTEKDGPLHLLPVF